MKNLARASVAIALATSLAACATPGRPARTGTAYECSAGTKLRVDYLANGALVSVNGSRSKPFAKVANNRGDAYESGGSRLVRMGNSVTWNSALKSAPESCRTVMTIN
ncbi:MAG: hypothetical protein IE933_13780 [Sphingomonadales bacterium]|nr:hypothetical protein [Sphingomonadales bacterium]MBD3775048.1 hypothetical protein [Paracoccaceae bacterium]